MAKCRQHFVGTLNNYTPEEVAYLRGPLPANVNYLIFGYEVAPDTGTPHLQIYGQLNRETKWTTMMNWPGWKRIGKLTSAKAESGPNERELAGDFNKPHTGRGYSMKGGNYVEQGEARDIKMNAGKRTDLAEIQAAITSGDTYDMLVATYFSTVAKYPRFIKEQVQARDTDAQLNALRGEYAGKQLRPWQQALLDIVLSPVDTRKIHWLWESVGNQGKSFMATYLGCVHGACILTAGRKVNMAYIYAQKPTRIVVFDLSRTNEPTDGAAWLDGMYSLAEELKNGRVVSEKYDSRTVYFQPPHVVFFANFAPRAGKWSEDRYAVSQIAGGVDASATAVLPESLYSQLLNRSRAGDGGRADQIVDERVGH